MSKAYNPKTGQYEVEREQFDDLAEKWNRQATQQRAEPAADETNPVLLWAEIHRLRAEVQGPDGYATWKDAAIAERKLRVAAQSGQRAANLSEATIQALWDEACNDSPQNPGWSRHIRFARAIEQAGQRAGDDLGWFVRNGTTHVLEAAALAGNTPAAKAYVATSRALGRLHDICLRHGCGHDEVMHDWLERVLAEYEALAGQRAGVAEGWKLVPLHPTDAMVEAGRYEDGEATARAVWYHMWKAAPTQQEGS